MTTHDVCSGASSDAAGGFPPRSGVPAPTGGTKAAAAEPRKSAGAPSGAIAVVSLIAAAYLGSRDYGANGDTLRAIGAAGIVFVLSNVALHCTYQVLRLVFQVVKIAFQLAVVAAVVLVTGNLMEYEWAATATTWVYGMWESLVLMAERLWAEYRPS